MLTRRDRLSCGWSHQQPQRQSRPPARGRVFEEIVPEDGQEFGAHRCSKCHSHASLPALDRVPPEAEEHPRSAKNCSRRVRLQLSYVSSSLNSVHDLDARTADRRPKREILRPGGELSEPFVDPITETVTRNPGLLSDVRSSTTTCAQLYF